MDISLRTATEAGDYLSHNNTTHDQMMQIEQTTDEGDGAAIKVFDNHGERR